MTAAVLVLNAGSGTLKAAVFEGEERTWSARLMWAAEPARLAVTSSAGDHHREMEGDSASLARQVIRAAWEGPTAVIEGPDAIVAAGHRIVHGGPRMATTVIDDAVRSDIEAAARWAPGHNDAALGCLDAASDLLADDAPHVAVFDTAFHATIPDAAAAYAGPREWWDAGLRRYGFHGISHAEVARTVGHDVGRLVSAHLGGGCSVTAIAEGRSVDTTMGLTPNEGLMMATRTGSVDPGLLLHLLREGHDADDLRTVLEERSGLLGLSEVSGAAAEVRDAARDGDEHAALAFDAYVHRIAVAVGGAAAALGGLDVLSFSGGVGEKVPEVRARVCERLGHLGVRLDEDRNAAATGGSADVGDGTASVVVVASDEERAVAREVRGTLTP